MNPQKTNFKNRESGATLLFVIILITVLALLGVGLYTLVMTSQLNQAEAQKSAKAYYLSESCLRIAASEYKYARSVSALDAAAALTNLNSSTVTLPGSQGSCAITLYPYWFYAPAAMTVASGSQQITLYLPGAVPAIEDNGSTFISLSFPSGVTAKLKKKGSSTEVYEFTSATFSSFVTGTGTSATFTLKSVLTSNLNIAAGDEFYLGAAYTMQATTPTAGGSLTLTLNAGDTTAMTGQIFPPVNGTIFIDITGVPLIKYDKRTLNNTTPKTVTLSNIQAVSGTIPTTINGASVDIYMGKSLGISSVATYGN